MTKVAIITRTKDRPLFLERAFISVSKQTFTDYVHVVVNDGGDKKAVDELVARQTTSIKDKIKVFHRESPSGAPDMIFNESIDKVKSDYIAIHDDDDTWHPEFLKQTVDALDSGAKGVVVRTDNVYEELSSGSIVKKKTSQYMPDMKVVSLYRQCLDNQLTAVAFVYRRDVYEEIGKYDASLPVGGDWEFGIRFLMKYDVEYIDPGFALAYYHRRIQADNSFHDHDHRTYVTKIQNKYLRQELKKGELGVGYIMSQLKYQEDVRHGIVKRILPKGLLNAARKKMGNR